jgi:Uma2 family endonuclease
MTAIATPATLVGEEYSPVLRGVSWETYERLRRELDEAGSIVHITYDRGRMVLMSPLPRHGKWSRLIGQLIEALAFEGGTGFSAFGDTTWKREDLQRGLEGDESYYIQHAEAMRGKSEIDLTEDPPPDLAVEVEVTHHPLDKASVYAALGVPELWRYDGRQMHVLLLQPSGVYAPGVLSAAFPGFAPAELHRFISMFPASLDMEITAEFRKWLRGQRG